LGLESITKGEVVDGFVEGIELFFEEESLVEHFLDF
jgi:hypothetical protein